jgi:hypothetical protein
MSDPADRQDYLVLPTIVSSEDYASDPEVRPKSNVQINAPQTPLYSKLGGNRNSNAVPPVLSAGLGCNPCWWRHRRRSAGFCAGKGRCMHMPFNSCHSIFPRPPASARTTQILAHTTIPTVHPTLPMSASYCASVFVRTTIHRKPPHTHTHTHSTP